MLVDLEFVSQGWGEGICDLGFTTARMGFGLWRILGSEQNGFKF